MEHTGCLVTVDVAEHAAQAKKNGVSEAVNKADQIDAIASYLTPHERGDMKVVIDRVSNLVYKMPDMGTDAVGAFVMGTCRMKGFSGGRLNFASMYDDLLKSAVACDQKFTGDSNAVIECVLRAFPKR